MDNISLINWDNINLAGKVWKEWCKYCSKFHFTELKPCSDCNFHYTPQPKSDKVGENCKAPYSHYICAGCEAYQDHYDIR